MEFASRHGLEHEHTRRELTHRWESYPFGFGNWRRARNVVRGTLSGRSITAFEYHFVLWSDDETVERDAFRHFLVCVVDLDHPVPALSAVRRDRLVWHPDEVEGEEFPVDSARWQQLYVVTGVDADFARTVLNDDRAQRCLQIDARAEWRFVGDEFIFWIESGLVDESLAVALDILRPLIVAAESYPR
ncbi:hypothetical protein [Petropleomorpha daqingensis]|uniref:Uncharacterized protein n=1 Tax=Petropleomorpha daqingensis TaxID=2026353 RepID=A0A853CQM2_9ACTN|nr:hypothetical protein [Petropleomorpha daqingensis]NYJ08223.1 hypothetical protein [Petropleomorpha daqingensis]